MISAGTLGLSLTERPGFLAKESFTMPFSRLTSTTLALRVAVSYHPIAVPAAAGYKSSMGSGSAANAVAAATLFDGVGTR